MDGSNSSVDDNDVDWNTDDEIDNFTLSPSSSVIHPRGEANVLSWEVSSAPSSPNTKVLDQFIGMGFSKKMVSNAIQKHGEENTDAILEMLLTYSALESSTHEQKQMDSDHFSSDYVESFLDGFSDMDSCDDEEIISHTSEEEKLMSLITMGYTEEEASMAVERCGHNSSLLELTDFLSAAQLAKEEDALLPLEEKPRLKHVHTDPKKKRKIIVSDISKRKRQMGHIDTDTETLCLPNPMIGFGIPTGAWKSNRILPKAAIGPPYFYYENVALTPKGVWDTISKFLYDVPPEFVDSKHFCCAARKRGYVHNLPTENRFPLVPLPPQTIHEAFPLTKKWWPSWDIRTKLNCIVTCYSSAKLSERIMKLLEGCDGTPPERVQRAVIHECCKWNLLWVGRNRVAPLEPDEVEMLMGFPKDHTRGMSRTDRYKSLGNAFQIHTVAYHFSVLRDKFPSGINVLSLFSGIGGAEVALHRLGIHMKNVVSIEISEVNRNVVRCWWEQTNQTGNLIHLADVKELDANRLEQLMFSFGSFDLVVGGSPCNNLTGSNRYHRDGLEGKESSLFYHYFRILDLVKSIMAG
ncbi:DNA (cytosine-5)-methyltransferase DRM2-like [Rosa rugosa]|uniref:DNA (cytosine-5)-methyltransferase DRM2-like n=1 Tax=Rosa rugosa TaxID=74645 RepID=UPI002B4007DC|nr:DNA (cytosine-5)-methyltransferase DRM2-like [Rosa rugosa]